MPTMGRVFEMSPDEISRHISDNLSVNTNQKHKFGEVFTPSGYINELLDQLPQNVWNNPALKWLEPSCGIGNFCLIVYSRLMSSLGIISKFPIKEDRHRHIIKNMLFMIEINPFNFDISRDLFGPEANINCGDFLNDSVFTDIDIIIGNPPFQTPRDGAQLSSKGGKTLWDKFIIKSLKILDSNQQSERFLCFITPPTWRKPKSDLWTLMTRDRHHLLYLHIFDKKKAIAGDEIQQRMDLFVIRTDADTNTNTNSSITDSSPLIPQTRIVESNENHPITMISSREWPFLPNSEFTLIRSILDFTPHLPSPSFNPNPNRIIYDRMAYASDTKNMSPTSTGEFIYPVVHTMTKRGLGIWYSKINTRGHFGIPKVILNFNEKLYPYLDSSGQYGMGQFSFGLPISSHKHGEDIVKALTSPQFQAVIKATKWGAYQTDRRMFEYFKDDFYVEFLS